MTVHSAHHTPRRTRLRVRRDRMDALQRELEQHPHVQSVVPNPVTGSLVVHHDAMNLDEVIAHLEASGIVAITGLPPEAGDVLANLGPVVLTAGLIVVAGWYWLEVPPFGL